MKIGILGSGGVGQALAKGFIAEGHEVMIATREPDGDKAAELKSSINGATVTDFATAGQQAELAVFCVKWDGAQEMVSLIGPENLAGKIVIDTSNIIMMKDDVMVYGGGDSSAAEQVQAWLPDSKVVKAFNTVGAALMCKPQLTATPTMIIAGDDAEAKKQVSDIVAMFGWEALDTGDLVCSREVEAMALIWIRNSMTATSPQAFKMIS